MLRSRTAVALALLAFGACAHTGDTVRSAKPNFLLIVADDLGFSDLGCTGGEIATPTLDALAAGGVRLTRFYTSARCCPSRGSLMTGQYPHRVGLGHMVKDLGRPGYRGRVSDRAVTLARALAPAGYRSFMSGKWHLGTPDPTKHGFEEFYGTLVSAKTFWDPDHFLRLPEGRKRKAYDPDKFYGTDALVDHAVDFLGQARETPGRPWFLYLAFNAPHFPLHAPADDIARYADTYRVGWDVIRERRLARMKELGIVPPDTPLTPRSQFWDWGEKDPGVNPAWDSLPADRRADLARRMAIYAAMVDRMDRGIGRVVADLKRAGELDNTLIVFLSDNGACAEWDPFGFDGKSSPDNVLHRGDAIDRMGLKGTYLSVGSGWANASNAPWRLYKHFTHEGGIASPGIIHWPAGLKRRGKISHEPLHIIDLMPTFVNAGGATYPSDAFPMVGTDMLPVLAGDSAPARDLFFEHERARAVHSGKWKLVSVAGGGWELYDMERDRTELKDLAEVHPGIVTRLSVKWNLWAKELDVTPPPRDYGVRYLPGR